MKAYYMAKHAAEVNGITLQMALKRKQEEYAAYAENHDRLQLHVSKTIAFFASHGFASNERSLWKDGKLVATIEVRWCPDIGLHIWWEVQTGDPRFPDRGISFDYAKFDSEFGYKMGRWL